MQLSENAGSKKAGVLVKTTLVDFPGIVASAIFLSGCNLRCPYCYNTGLVLNNGDAPDAVTLQEVVTHLEQRKSVIKGFVISGGEALLSPMLLPLLRAVRELGYKVKLDTNGIADNRLEDLIRSEYCPDFIALDIKTSPARYAELAPAGLSEEKKNKLTTSLLHSVKLVSSLPADRREFRTVLVPPLVKEDDIRSIAAELPSDASWMFAQFRNENCLNPEYNNVSPYIQKELDALVSTAQSLIPGAKLR
ncbi:MAG: anaerobic ribonucleoside-triphosphate reductase activating protein [Treponema sp.]|nr:anaerobic ribonucleoside-triphosphate reductase activating protein [Candidatus Treponema caballi]